MITLNFKRCDHATIVLIIVLINFENVFYLEKSFLSYVIFHLKLFYLYDFSGLQIMYPIPVYTCYMICLTRCGMLGMWYAREGAY